MRLVRMTGVALATMAVVAAPASAKTIALHYFSKQVSAKFTDAAGHPVNPNKPPVAGDVFDFNDVDYVGNHKHHAKHWTASDHLRCVFTSSTAATCDGQVAIGGSMLLANGIHPNFGANPSRFTLNGGTGVFQGGHGTLTSVNIGKTNNADITIRVRI
jgi:hypothetical protein